MTELKRNLVRLNLPLVPNQHYEAPDPKKPIITIDDKEILGVTRLRVEAGVGELTLVRLEFYADVEGVAHAGTDMFRDGGILSEEARAHLSASLRDVFPSPRRIIVIFEGEELAVLKDGTP